MTGQEYRSCHPLAFARAGPRLHGGRLCVVIPAKAGIQLVYQSGFPPNPCGNDGLDNGGFHGTPAKAGVTPVKTGAAHE